MLPPFIKLSAHPGNLDPSARLVDCQPYAGVYQTANGFVGTLPAGMAFEGYFSTREEAKNAVTKVMDGFKRGPTKSTPTVDERDLLNHVSMFGSEGYPIKRVGSRNWSWSYRDSINTPSVYKTKREAVASFEAYHSMLLDRLAGRI